MNRRAWKKEELAIVRELYPHRPTSELAAKLDRPVDTIYRMAHKLDLRKTPEYLASPFACRLRRGDNVGAAFRFKKGQTPPNKGLRRPGYAPGRMAETQFKKGEATNWMPVGSTRLIDGYVYRKISDVRNVPWMRNWVPENWLVWEEATGRKRPPGYAIIYKNGNRLDNRYENFELITRADLARRNSIHNLPPELKKTIHTLGTLKRRIRKHEKQDRRSA